MTRLLLALLLCSCRTPEEKLAARCLEDLEGTTACLDSCNQGVAGRGGCLTAGRVYLHRYGVPPEPGPAAKMFELGCDRGSASSCTELGTLARIGEGVPLDLSRARKLYERACNAGSALGCAGLGMIFHEGLGVTRDDVAAAGHFKRSCDGGSHTGCAALGLLYETGSGVPLDAKRSGELIYQAMDLNRACNRGKESPASCPE